MALAPFCVQIASVDVAVTASPAALAMQPYVSAQAAKPAGDAPHLVLRADRRQLYSPEGIRYVPERDASGVLVGVRAVDGGPHARLAEDAQAWVGAASWSAQAGGVHKFSFRIDESPVRAYNLRAGTETRSLGQHLMDCIAAIANGGVALSASDAVSRFGASLAVCAIAIDNAVSAALSDRLESVASQQSVLDAALAANGPFFDLAESQSGGVAFLDALGVGVGLAATVRGLRIAYALASGRTYQIDVEPIALSMTFL